ncbi:hypothetical protein T03_6078 [Trichinella britovi]|uniref:Uncharacterized protein n=1 Tax=Trichinella britovi TaxID=45882 RepID=A0A0V1CIC0_TRIBR|nr:hypothetical protein T03_6078 [Trichinella britovi]
MKKDHHWVMNKMMNFAVANLGVALSNKGRQFVRRGRRRRPARRVRVEQLGDAVLAQLHGAGVAWDGFAPQTARVDGRGPDQRGQYRPVHQRPVEQRTNLNASLIGHRIPVPVDRRNPVRSCRHVACVRFFFFPLSFLFLFFVLFGLVPFRVVVFFVTSSIGLDWLLVCHDRRTTSAPGNGNLAFFLQSDLEKCRLVDRPNRTDNDQHVTKVGRDRGASVRSPVFRPDDMDFVVADVAQGSSGIGRREPGADVEDALELRGLVVRRRPSGGQAAAVTAVRTQVYLPAQAGDEAFEAWRAGTIFQNGPLVLLARCHVNDRNFVQLAATGAVDVPELTFHLQRRIIQQPQAGQILQTTKQKNRFGGAQECWWCANG